MVSNASYAAYGGRPAAWSPRVLRLLRGLGFRGATITDALEALATTQASALDETAIRAARAGVDLLLFVGSERSTERVYDALLADARAGPPPAGRARAQRGPRSTSSPRRTRARSPPCRRPREIGRERGALRRGARSASRAGAAASAPRSGSSSSSARRARERRSPARALGSLPGFVDLDEVQPWKAAIPGLIGQPEDERRGAAAADPRARAHARPRARPPRRRADPRDELRARARRCGRTRRRSRST